MFFDCNDFCNELEPLNDRKVIFGSDAYEYVSNPSGFNKNIQSYHGSYFRLIRSNRMFPGVPQTFQKLSYYTVS